MIICKSIDSEHLDLIHDVKYDFYGRRMLTCSSDQNIKVWELMEDQEWQCASILQGHIGSVWKVSWAHPEFGQVIASCGFDRTIIIWEEITNNQQSCKSDWVRRTQLVDPRTPVTDIKFSPRHLGLQLAACSTDGIIRLYEAQDVMDLSQWTLQHDFTSNVKASSLSWSTNSSYPSLISVGNCNPDNTETKVVLYEYNEQKRTWDCIESLDKINGSVNDVEFAPCMGHSYHTLAVAASQLYVFYLKPLHDNIDFQESQPSQSSKYRIEVAQIFEPIPSLVWRVNWNISGTILAASGEDGSVKFLRRNYMRVWREVSHIRPDSQAPTMIINSSQQNYSANQFAPQFNSGKFNTGSTMNTEDEFLTNQTTEFFPRQSSSNNIQFEKKGNIPTNKSEFLH